MLLWLGYLIFQPTKENFIKDDKMNNRAPAQQMVWEDKRQERKKRGVRLLVADVVFVRGPGLVISLLIGEIQRFDWKDIEVAIETTKSGKKASNYNR